MGNDNGSESKNKTTKDKDGKTSFSELKGTKVYDAEGEKFGHVSDIEVNMTTLSPTCLIIHKGFFGEYLKIDLKYIENITPDRITLWISPAKNLVGSKVTDREGTEIGFVDEAEKDKNGDLEYIRVRARIIRTRDEDGELERYSAPMVSFEDMSITLPSSPMEEGPIATYMDVKTEEIKIDSEEIITVHEDKIVLRGKKEDYIK